MKPSSAQSSNVAGGRTPSRDEVLRLVEQAFSSIDPAHFLNLTASEGSNALAGDDAIPTFRRNDGLVLSAISNRSFLRDLACMIMPLEGKRVFEIGSGTGYLACVLSGLCGTTGQMQGCEIIPQLWSASRNNVLLAACGNVSLTFGDFVEVLPEKGLFDVVIGTSSFSLLHASIINACSPEGGLIVLPIEIPGGGDCMTIFQRRGSTLLVKDAMLSVSVPTTGHYSDREVWAPQVGHVLPDWHVSQKTMIGLPSGITHTIPGTLAFRSFLLFDEPLYQAVSVGAGPLSRADDMAFGLICTSTRSCCLQRGHSLILQGRRALELAERFVTRRRLWESRGRPSLATYRYSVDLTRRAHFAFVPALSSHVGM